MKLNLKLQMGLATVAAISGMMAPATSQAFGIQPTCYSQFSTEVDLGVARVSDATGAWRKSITNLSAAGETAATSQAREDWILNTTASQLTFLNKEVDTPEMTFAAAEGVTITPSAASIKNETENPIPLAYPAPGAAQGFHYEQVARVKVTGLGPSGQLKGTLLLPVSGHTGLTNSKAWAKTDKYSIYLTKGRQVVATLAKNVPSLGIITMQEIDAKLTPGEVYAIEYHRGGSGGPGGYSEGRVIEFVWDGI